MLHLRLRLQGWWQGQGIFTEAVLGHRGMTQDVRKINHKIPFFLLFYTGFKGSSFNLDGNPDKVLITGELFAICNTAGFDFLTYLNSPALSKMIFGIYFFLIAILEKHGYQKE